MGRGMNTYEDKQKRAMRRRNHMARDLADRKYHQRIKKPYKELKDVDWDDYEF